MISIIFKGEHKNPSLVNSVMLLRWVFLVAEASVAASKVTPSSMAVGKEEAPKPPITAFEGA